MKLTFKKEKSILSRLPSNCFIAVDNFFFRHKKKIIFIKPISFLLPTTRKQKQVKLYSESKIHDQENNRIPSTVQTINSATSTKPMFSAMYHAQKANPELTKIKDNPPQNI